MSRYESKGDAERDDAPDLTDRNVCRDIHNRMVPDSEGEYPECPPACPVCFPWVSCGACGGSGGIDDMDCAVCGGAGELRQ